MIAATLDWEETRPNEVAVALAAIQIDKPVRVVIIREDFDDKSNKNFVVLINPEIVKYEGDIVYDQEGCLSVKDVYGNVPRYSKVRVRAIDIRGNRVHFITASISSHLIHLSPVSCNTKLTTRTAFALLITLLMMKTPSRY